MIHPNDPRFAAALKLLERTGMRQFQLRYHDDEEPTVWIAAAMWRIGPDGRPKPKGGREAWECAGALDPFRAVMRLCDQTMDGGTCAHCGRPTGVIEDFTSTMPLADVLCWYVYDPELQVFRRSCEGET